MTGVAKDRLINTLVPFRAQINSINRGEKVTAGALFLTEVAELFLLPVLGYGLMHAKEVPTALAASIPLGIYAVSRLAFAVVTEPKSVTPL
jgi:hypothetical protein